MDKDESLDRQGGYLAAASWLARDVDNETLIFRKFDTLSAANLLYLQSEILELEKRLDNFHLVTVRGNDMDLKDAASTWETLVEQSRTGATRFRQDAKEQIDLIKELREKLREYRKPSNPAARDGLPAIGSLVGPKSPRAQANRGNSFFHVDSSFNPRRAGYSLLLSHELPPPDVGGNTEFCDTRKAWDGLDDDFKKELLEKNYVACHSILHSKKLAAPEHFANIEPADYPMGRHRLVQKHERSGRMNLYLAMHIHPIEGLGAEESKELFEKLFEHATQDKYRVMVEWKDVGDLVIWDNTATMHRAVGGEFAYKYRRDMRRATVHDDSSQAWGLNEHKDVRQGLP
ncbi:hypothetical protein COL922a_011118 [Colletotrichum nupharicola]|nr:hypothetical protein COL922a_011118 [Colletotrichum nupharicola]